MKKGSKKSPLTKEQLLQQEDIKRKRKIIIEQFYPALKGATISIDEALQLLNAAGALIMEDALEKLRVTHMREIKSRLVKKLCPNHEREVAIEHLLGVFDDLTLFETRGHLENMRRVIEQMKMDEMRDRKLDSLKEDWNRYLNG